MPKVIPFRLRSNLFCRALDLPQKAPNQFIIFNSGNNPGDDGPAIYDDKAAELVMSEFKKRGVMRLTIDYDHASIKPESRPQDRIAAGWFTPEDRNGNCHAKNVNWTDAAKKAIENKEWLYISPVFTKDENGRITSLVNLAITNNPATWGARPLIAASRGLYMDPNLPMLFACLLAVAGGAEPFAAWAKKNADEMLAMAGENAGAIQETAKQYMVSTEQTTASNSMPPDQNQVAASSTSDQTQVAASTTAETEDEKAARSLTPETAALLARSQMVAETVDSTVKRSAEIEKLQGENLLPKNGPVVVYARSCNDADFGKFAGSLRASGATVRTAGVKLPVGGKNVAAGKNGVNTGIDPLAIRSAVKQSGIDQKKLETQILRNREKAANAEK